MSTISIAQPFESRLLFICGDQSGVGKSSISMGILSLLLQSKLYKSDELAYIKPCTQCEDIQLVCKFCEENSIEHRGLGPIIFYQGYTQSCIDGSDTSDTVESRRNSIKSAIQKIAKGKKLVLVDGVGYPAVGSVCGVSNADVAYLLSSPVLVVGRPGIGNAIDAMNYIIDYFNFNKVQVIGGVWNKIPLETTVSYHTYDSCKQYVTKFYNQTRPNKFSCYGFIPLTQSDTSLGANKIMKVPESKEEKEELISCRLRAPKTDLIFTEKERAFTQNIIKQVGENFDIKALLRDLDNYYKAFTPYQAKD